MEVKKSRLRCGWGRRLWKTQWPEFRLEEVGLTSSLVLGIGATYWLLPHPPSGWKRDLPFDEPVRDLLRADGAETRESLSALSDGLQVALLAYPLFVDIGLVAWLDRDDPKLAAQMLAINVQSYALSTAIILLTKRTVGRVRPETEPCPPSTDDFFCRGDGGRVSFISGHAASAFTSAGLVCAHHHFVRLYGDEQLDGLACGAALTVASSVALLRVAADRHYATDVLAGAAVGLASGFALPYLLHYWVDD